MFHLSLRASVSCHTVLCLLSRNIFADSGVEWKNYRYYDPKTIGLDFEGMLEDLGNAPDGSVVVLHGEFSFGKPLNPFFLPLEILDHSWSFLPSAFRDASKRTLQVVLCSTCLISPVSALATGLHSGICPRLWLVTGMSALLLDRMLQEPSFQGRRSLSRDLLHRCFRLLLLRGRRRQQVLGGLVSCPALYFVSFHNSPGGRLSSASHF